MRRSLGWFDLFCFGIGSMIGAGIFVLVGLATEITGPGISISYAIGAFTCILSGLCYAEFASAVPLCGSAYTYTYITMGEFPAFLIGWALIGEYIFSAAAVARGCSSYIQYFVQSLGGTFPPSLVYKWGFLDLDVVAGLLVILITFYLFFGIRIASTINSIFALLSLGIILFLIVFGSTEVDVDNWADFVPNGVESVFKGAGFVFFSYVGFDMIASYSEEVIDPQKDLPIAILSSIVLVALLYISVALVLTGMVPYWTIMKTQAPIAEAFKSVRWAAIIISVGATCSLVTSTQNSLSCCNRMLLAMSRDGLLPSVLGSFHPRTSEPWVANFVTGTSITLISLLFDLPVLSHAVSAWTLCAFTFVNAAIIILREKVPEKPHNKNLSKYLIFYILSISVFSLTGPRSGMLWLNIVLFGLCGIPFVLIFMHFYLYLPYPIIVNTKHFFSPLVPLVPLLGIFFNIYLLFSLPDKTWLPFGVWSLVGMVFYGLYGYWNSTEKRQEVLGETSPLLRDEPYDA
uniref:Cationic amino acid transporter C-terminal domain-containing protein n=1 Tax=Arcella intermedia TaxID=1963864 RepID=A0A6B2L254_9EUKA